MGKAQSKRSVDITIEGGKKRPENDEVTGKLEKIKVADQQQKQVNRDVTPGDNPNEGDVVKEDLDEGENDKDLTTEKYAGSGETENQYTTNTATVEALNEGGAGDSINVLSSANKDDAAATTNANATEEISPLVDDGEKKSKKEKSKRKWSFRSISFSKKDKQKPSKTEETSEATAAAASAAKTAVATNSDAENTTPTGAKNEKNGDDDAAASAAEKPVENGDASEKKLNAQKTPSPVDEKPTNAGIVNNETTTINITTTTIESASYAPAANSNETKNSVIEIPTEKKKIAVVGNSETTVSVSVVLTNDDFSVQKNALSVSSSDDLKDKVAAVTDAVAEMTIKTIPSVAVVVAASEIIDGDKPHQNGTSGDHNNADDIKS